MTAHSTLVAAAMRMGAGDLVVTAGPKMCVVKSVDTACCGLCLPSSACLPVD